ncbi:hypothetical protein [Lysinibacillus pakistanensis]|uniref:hypothetical protein n=1 Tax=Lysinibacillus pakistanensis TaxID=759811 RepID=UPI003D2B3FA1
MNIEKLVIILTVLGVVLSDLMLGHLSLGDVTIFCALLLAAVDMLSALKFKIKISHLLLFLSFLIIIISNFLLNLNINNSFQLTEGIFGLVKFIYYGGIVIVLINYIKFKKIEYMTLKILATIAVITSIIGIYIAIAILLDGLLPYKFFWALTRDEYESYMFVTSAVTLVRIKSIFSEPAHLGVFLNMVLALSYFNHFNFKLKSKYIIVIYLTIFFTLSFSAVITLIFINVFYFLGKEKISKLISRKSSWISVCLLLLTGIFLWDIIEKALFSRITFMINGVDESAKVRLIGTWGHISEDYFIIGNGIGNSPFLSNIYSYILSDLGLLSLIIYIFFNIFLLYKNYKLGVIFILINFAKGGYLAVGFWVCLLMFIVFSLKDTEINRKKTL